MKTTVILVGAALVLALAVTPVTFATSDNSQAAYESCLQDPLAAADLSSFEEIIEEFKAAMTRLRGDKDTLEERMQLKKEKRDSLLEIVPDGFEERFGGINKNQNTKNQARRNKSN